MHRKSLGSFSEFAFPLFEALEIRQLLNVAPIFATPLPDAYWVGSGARAIGVDGADADGDPVAVTAVSDNPLLQVSIPSNRWTPTGQSGNVYARLHFVTSDGKTVIGDIVTQLFNDRAAAAAQRFIDLATHGVKIGAAASRTITMSSSLTFQAAVGTAGNACTVQLKTGASLGVAVTGQNIVVTATADTSLAALVDAVNANAAVQALGVTASFAGAGTTLATAAAKANLTSGSATSAASRSIIVNSANLVLKAQPGGAGNTFSLELVPGTQLRISMSGPSIVVNVPDNITVQTLVNALNDDSNIQGNGLTVSLTGSATALVVPAGAVNFSGGTATQAASRSIVMSTSAIFQAAHAGPAGNKLSVTIQAGSSFDIAVAPTPAVATGTTADAVTYSGDSSTINATSGLFTTAMTNMFVRYKSTGNFYQIYMRPDADTVVVAGDASAETGDFDIIDGADVVVTIAPNTTVAAMASAVNAHATLQALSLRAGYVGAGGSLAVAAAKANLAGGASAAVASRTIQVGTVTVKLQAAIGEAGNNYSLEVLPGSRLNVALNGSRVVATVRSDTTVQALVDALNAALGSSGLTASFVGAGGLAVMPTSKARFTGGAASLTGAPFYSDVNVHRAIPGFMVQMGDKTNGDGSGSTGLSLLPLVTDPDLSFDGQGVFGMARRGDPWQESSDGQFFITDGVYDGGNGQYIIFGQMISGADALTTLINSPADQSQNGNGRVYDPPLLDYVQIFESNQDAVVMVKPLAGFTGNATVTITLDDAQGHQTTKQLTITPKTELGNRPQITTVPDKYLTPGTPMSFAIAATDDKSMPMHFTLEASDSRATVSIDDATKQATLSVPANYTGIFTVNVTAVEKGYADLTPSSTSFLVLALNGQMKWVDTTSNVPMACQQVGDLLYMADGAAGLRIYDAHDPNNVTFVDDFTQIPGTTPTNINARDVLVIGNTVYLVVGTNGLVTLDVTTPSSITYLDWIKIPAQSGANQVAVSITVVGTTAYVPYYEGGLAVFDVTNPADIKTREIVTMPFPYRPLYRAMDVVAQGKYVYVSDRVGQVFVLDGSGSALKYVSAFVTGGGSWGMDIQDNKLYIADEYAGLLVFNVSNPLLPKLLGKYNPGTYCWDVKVVNQTAILSTQDNFQLVDVSDPKAMTKELELSAYANGVAGVSGTRIILPVTDGGVVLLDASEQFNRVLTHSSVSFADGADHRFTVTAKGATVKLYTSGIGGGDIQRIEVFPATKSASVTITGPAGVHTSTPAITIHGNMGSFNAAGLDLNGNLIVEGNVASIVLGNAGNGSLSYSGTAAFSFTAGAVSDFKINSSAPVKALHVGSWADSSADADVTAPWVASLLSDGDFAAGLSLSGVGATKATLGAAKIGGDLSSADWDITGAMGNLTVAGWALQSTVRTTLNMGTITLGRTHLSDFLAGVKDTAGRHANTIADFDSLATIKGVKITGVAGAPRYFSDSNFSASTIGSVSLLNVQADGTDEFGFFVRRTDAGGELKSAKVTDTATRQSFTWSAKTSEFLAYRDLIFRRLGAGPVVTHSFTDTGGGVYGNYFGLTASDGLSVSFFADVKFEGYGGGVIQQLQAGGLDVNSNTAAANGSGGYDMAKDSYFYEPFTSNLMIPISQASNLYGMQAGTGIAGLSSADLAYIAATGTIKITGSVTRNGTTYVLNGIVMP